MPGMLVTASLQCWNRLQIGEDPITMLGLGASALCSIMLCMMITAGLPFGIQLKLLKNPLMEFIQWILPIANTTCKSEHHLYLTWHQPNVNRE